MWNPFAKNSESVKAGKTQPSLSTQLYLRIAEIRDDTLVLKNGGLRAILHATSINFNLKSEEEQKAIILAYQAFLNTLDFPVQIIIRSRKLDLDKYIETLKSIGEKQENQLLKKQTFDYVDYIQRIIEYADIMEKEFYVVVPMDPFRAQKKTFVEKFWERMHPQDSVPGILQRQTEFEQLKKTLQQRVNTVTGGLERTSIKVSQLTTQEIIALFYQIYNPLTARNQKITDVSSLHIASDAALGRA